MAGKPRALRRAALLLVCLWPLAVSAEPAPGEADGWSHLEGLSLNPNKDWLQLTSGEVLQGRFDEFYAETLHFDSDVLDDLEIDFDQVRRWRTVGWYQVNLGGLGIHRGRLWLDGDWLRIEGQTVLLVTRAEVLSIYKVAGSELDRWDNKVTLSVNLSRGNSNIAEINGKLSSERKTAAHRTNFDYLGVFSESENQTTARNHRITLSHDIFRDNRLFLRPVQADLFHAPLQNIKLQSELGAQLGYAVIEEKRRSWDLAVGPSLRRIRFEEVEPGSDASESSLGVVIGSRLNMELTDRIELNHDYTLSLSPERTGGLQHHSVFNLEFELTDRIDLDLDFVWDYTQSPTADAEGQRPRSNDYRFGFGLGVDF